LRDEGDAADAAWGFGGVFEEAVGFENMVPARAEADWRGIGAVWRRGKRKQGRDAQYTKELSARVFAQSGKRQS